jgi:Zn-dependent alcohol dehydrogenase
VSEPDGEQLVFEIDIEQCAQVRWYLEDHRRRSQGKVKVMTETYPFDQVQQAYERVEQGKARFRAVLTF